MQLVEVISGAERRRETLSVVEDLAEDLGKTPVRVHKDSPGFIVVNRILVPLMNEAAWLVSNDEATIAEVDSTTKFDMGPADGQLRTRRSGRQRRQLPRPRVHARGAGRSLRASSAPGGEGRERGVRQEVREGFYDYEDGEGVQIPTDEQSSEFVKKRLLATMANEAAKLIGGDVAPPESIDEAVQLGAGFPDGPVKLVDDYGLAALHETLEEAYERTGHERYAPAEYLAERADEGGFYER